MQHRLGPDQGVFGWACGSLVPSVVKLAKLVVKRGKVFDFAKKAGRPKT